MTTRLDTRLIPKIKSIIAKYGKTVTFRVETGATINQVDGSAVAGTTTEYSVKVTPPGTPQGSKASFARQIEDDQVTIVGALGFMVASQGLAFQPAIGMVVVIDGAEWMVSALEPIFTGDDIGGWVLVVSNG